MDTDFWHQRWHRGETGWHLERVNPLLERHWPQLASVPGGRVFVPLCGKSKDMAWLARQGYRVVGAELSAAAARAFFAEHGWTPDIAEAGDATWFRSGPIEILCGNYFDIGPGALGTVDAVYDRGALVALPPVMRERYVDHLRTVLPSPVTTLLITLDYPPHEMNGPPFPVSENAVTRYFGTTHAVRLLAAVDALADSPGFRDRGLTTMTENVFAFDAQNRAVALTSHGVAFQSNGAARIRCAGVSPSPCNVSAAPTQRSGPAVNPAHQEDRELIETVPDETHA